MSEKTLTGKDIGKRILPVLLAIILIVLIAVIATTAKSCNSKNPVVKDPDEVFMELGDLKVKNSSLYTYLKQTYGTAELLRLVDEKLYASDLDKIDTEELDKFILKSLLSVEEISKYVGDPQEEWDEIIQSLRMNNLLTKKQAEDKDINNRDSEVWTVVRSYYRLQYAREEWAKAEFIKRYKEERKEAEKDVFDEDDIKEYYDKNYTGTVYGFFIPFTSEKAALSMMSKYGINTQTNVLSKDGWVTSDYNYNEDYTIADDQYLTSKEVIEAFVKMYNEVYSYYNSGKDIITADKYSSVVDEERSLYNAKLAVMAMLKKYSGDIEGDFVLPTTAVINGLGDATIEWSIADSEIVKLNADGKTVTVNFGEKTATSVSVKFTATLKYGEYVVSLTETVKIKNSKEKAEVLNLVLEEAKTFETYEFDKEFLKEPGNDFSKLSWTDAEMSKINSTLATYLGYNSTKLTNDLNPENFYKSYTVKPVAVGDYYYLIIKLDDEAALKLEDDGVKDEIIQKMLDELVTENDITRLAYENRTEHGFKIYDRYLEAIYDYQYTYFFETTLKTTDYTKYKYSKKKTTTVAASFEIDGKKQEIIADDLFKSLKDKYGVSVTVDLINQYKLISNTEYNKIYNPYTDSVLDKVTLKELLDNEVSSFRKNFELDYFTYSYLSYYGFTPNFPASYGWDNFKSDYFGASTDEQLLVSNSFGGTIYSTALESLYKKLYNDNDVLELMNKSRDEYFKVSVINLIVYVDYNYDSTLDDNTVGQVDADKDDANIKVANWTDEQRALAKELADLFYEKAIETGEASLASQLSALVTLYKAADLNIPLETPGNKTIYEYNYFAKYKKAGLMVKFEKAADYDSSSEIVKEFADVCKELYTAAVDADLLGTTLDIPLISKEAFETSFGYHKIAVLSTTEATRLPTAEEIEVFKLLAEIEKYKESTYTFGKERHEKALARIKEILGDEYKADLTGDDYEEYTQDEEAKAAIEAWYSPAIKELEGGDLLTEDLIKYLEDNYNNIKYSTDQDAKMELLKYIVEVSKQDLEDEDED